MTTGSPEALIRSAGPEDAGTILRLLRELAAFQGLLDQARASEADILRDGFGERPCFECLLAEIDGRAVGIALFYPFYSTFDGRPGIYIEDLYVADDARGQRLGHRLMAHLAGIALARDCRRLKLSMLHWNPARGFYSRLGFSAVADWQPLQLAGDALERLARGT